MYVLPAVVLWVCVLESGVHATIAGVVLGLLTPARPIDGHEVIEPIEARLHPWSSFLIVPLFALANAGVYLGGGGVEPGAEQPDHLGDHPRPRHRQAARHRRRPSALAHRLRLGRLPDGVRLKHLVAAGAVAGIGFTVSLFVADLSYNGVRLDDAKVAILGASVISGIVGLTLLRLTTTISSR